MCGISGILFNHGNLKGARTLIEGILDSQSDRGPDNQNLITVPLPQSTLFLGHNRLAVIDLSDNANQPMRDPSGRYTLVFNGMIYNYIELREELRQEGIQFKTTSDTEVVLMALIMWGKAALSRFNGMFAFAFFDEREQQLLLARDRFGIKPLFYHASSQEFVFASSSTVMAKHFQLKPNLDYLARGMAYSVYENGLGETPYKNLHQCPPGHCLEIALKDGCIHIKNSPWYDLTQALNKKREVLRCYSDSALVDQFKDVFQNAVNLRLRSDVPMGISLSGGLDSTSLMASIANDYACEGISFGAPDDKNSEGHIVQEAANTQGMKVHYLQTPSEEFNTMFWKTLERQDAPFSSLSIVAQDLVFQKAKQLGLKVMLGGQGGDEILLGYRKYQLFYLQQLLREKKYWGVLKTLPGFSKTLLAESGQCLHYWRQRARYSRATGMSHRLIGLDAEPLAIGLKANNKLWQRQVRDICNISLPSLLRYEDRNSMGNSIESRLPFLDYQLVEFAASLPYRLKLKNGYGKWILRNTMKSALPNTICKARYKRGFDIGQEHYIRAGLGAEIRDKLQEGIKELEPYLPQAADINVMYSDTALSRDPMALTEAITLLWLSK